MKQTACNKGLFAVAAFTLGVLGAGCDSDSGQSSTDAGANTASTSAGPSTSMPPAPKAVAVAYTRTYVGDSTSPPPEKFRVEVSLDGASFRMTADDGSRDLAYDAAGGRAYEWGSSRDGSAESAALITGLASGGPDHNGLTDGPGDPLAVLVRALGRAGDPRVTTVTRLGRPAWHYDGPMAGDQLGGEPAEDHVVTDVDHASGLTLLQVISGKGQVIRRFEATSIENRASEDRSRYRPDPPATAKINQEDHGFRPVTLDEVASAAGYDVLVPGSVPAGFELDEVLFDAEAQLRTGAEALNPAPARVTSLRWIGPGGSSFTVTLRPENGDPEAEREGAEWSDPFGSEGTELPAETVSIPVEGRQPLKGELFVAAPGAPHLWGTTGDVVVTVDGDLDAAGLKAVAGSLKKHPKPASSGAPTKCQQIGFTPNSDDVAGDITATGLDCTTASDVVRRVRERHDPVTGRRFFRSPPFACRAARQERALESTAYRCDDGARRVTWNKT